METQAPPPPGPTDRRRLPAILLLAVALVYGRAVTFPYVIHDDGGYVFENPAVLDGLSPRGVAWAFRSTELSNWHPLAWLSHMADVTLFGPGPAGPHAVNVVLHGAVSLLLYLVLASFTGSRWKSLAAALLFSLHPLRVEVVAWVSERKELLCATFLLSALWSYGRYAKAPSAARYALVAVLFAMALLSKPMAVTFPFVLLLLDYWPLRRFPFSPPLPPEGGEAPSFRGDSTGRLLLEKAPLLLLTAASSLVTLWAQDRGGALSAGEAIRFSVRWRNALVSAAKYLGETLFPSGLSPYYTHPVVAGREIPSWEWIGAALLLASLSLLAFRRRSRLPAVAVGWCWFLGTLVPVAGLAQVGLQAMADRYTYLPSMGLSLAAAWGIPAVLPVGEGWRRRLPTAALVAVSAALAVAASLQLGHWRSSSALFERVVAADGESSQSLHLLGQAYLGEGRFAEGAAAQERSIRLYPVDPGAWRGLALCYEGMGRTGDSASALRQALRVSGGAPDDWYNLAAFGARNGMRGETEEGLRGLAAVDPARAAALAAAIAESR